MLLQRAAVLDRQHDSEAKHTFLRYAHLPKRETALTALRLALRDNPAVSWRWGVCDDTLLLS